MSNPGVSVAFLRQLKESASQIYCRVYLSFVRVRERIAVNRMKRARKLNFQGEKRIRWKCSMSVSRSADGAHPILAPIPVPPGRGLLQDAILRLGAVSSLCHCCLCVIY